MMINNEMFSLHTLTEEYFGKTLAEYFSQESVADSLHVFGFRESQHRLVWSGHLDSR
jgi:hypothetical protein